MPCCRGFPLTLNNSNENKHVNKKSRRGSGRPRAVRLVVRPRLVGVFDSENCLTRTAAGVCWPRAAGCLSVQTGGEVRPGHR